LRRRTAAAQCAARHACRSRSAGRWVLRPWGLVRGWLKRLEREAREDFVEVRQRDGRVLYFERMEVLKALFLARYDAALGRSPEPSAVLDALEGATPASRRAVEEISSTGTFFDLEPRDPTAPPIEDLSEP
jgi:hypothetical protein